MVVGGATNSKVLVQPLAPGPVPILAFILLLTIIIIIIIQLIIRMILIIDHPLTRAIANTCSYAATHCHQHHHHHHHRCRPLVSPQGISDDGFVANLQQGEYLNPI